MLQIEISEEPLEVISNHEGKGKVLYEYGKGGGEGTK